MAQSALPDLLFGFIVAPFFILSLETAAGLPYRAALPGSVTSWQG